jgi:predicted DNA binding CopG/RHH family protein
MSKKLKEIPKFANETEEREFWLAHDTTDYVDWSKAKRVTFPNLKLTTQSISLRLLLWMLESIKTTANRQDVPYQSLIKVWLNEKLEAAHHGIK